MRYLKTYESLYENPLVLELKDIALDLTDFGFNVQIFRDRQITSRHELTTSDDNIRAIITHKDDFTMTDRVRDFIFRSTGFMKEHGYDFEINSNHSRLHTSEDGRVFSYGHTFTERFPTLTIVNILFKK